MRIEKLEEYNEWWFTKKVPEQLTKTTKRTIYDTLTSVLNKRQIKSLVGLRRVGKTTLMYQLIEKLLLEGVDEKLVFYFSFDEVVKDLDELINTYKEKFSLDFRKQKIFLFLDEIQKLNNWAEQIKKYYDLYPNLNFVISGSESLFISSKTRETLAGRIYEFFLKTLSFREYLIFKEIDPTKTSSQKLKELFRDYVSKGGFPELIEKDPYEAKMYVKTLIDKVIFQDLTKIAGIRETDLMRVLVEIIAVNPGMYLEYQSLAKQLDHDRRVIKMYISLLEQSFIIKVLRNYRKGRLASIKKIKKIYVTDSAIMSTYKNKIDDLFFSKMVESVVANSSDSSYFWKNSKEVDLVEDELPIEVKFKTKITEEDLEGVKQHMKHFSSKKGLILTKDYEDKIKLPEGIIELIPVWKWLLSK